MISGLLILHVFDKPFVVEWGNADDIKSDITNVNLTVGKPDEFFPSPSPFLFFFFWGYISDW